MNEIPVVLPDFCAGNGMPESHANMQYIRIPQAKDHSLEAEYIDPSIAAKIIPEMQKIIKDNEHMRDSRGCSNKFLPMPLNNDGYPSSHYAMYGMTNGHNAEPGPFNLGQYQGHQGHQQPFFFECNRASLESIAPELNRKLGSIPIAGFMVMDNGHTDEVVVGVPMAVFLKEVERGTLTVSSDRSGDSAMGRENPSSDRRASQHPMFPIKKENISEGDFPGSRILLEIPHIRDHHPQLSCSKCNIRLKSLIEFEVHMQEKHAKLDEYNCGMCGVGFGNLDFLLSHIRIHNIKRTYRCKLCGKGFSFHSQWKHHLKLHDKKSSGPFCRSCQKSYTSSRAYGYHTLKCNNAVLQCEFCPFESSIFSDFHNHSKKHTCEKTRCGICQKSFPTVLDLDHHRSSHARSESLLCSHCGVIFPSRKKLLLHRRLYRLHGKKKFMCVECGAKFAGIRPLKQHKLSQHSILEKISYQCQECFISFESRIALSKHSRKVHSKQTKSSALQLLTLTCDLCAFNSSSKWKFEEHFSLFHPSILPYKCSQCILRLRSLDEYRDHSEIHSRSFLHQTFPCCHCYRVFFAESALRRHIEDNQIELSKEKEDLLFRYTLSPSSPCDSDEAIGENKSGDVSNQARDEPCFECDFCAKRLTSAFHIKEHFITDHYSLPPYKCRKCRKRFVTPLLCRRHEANTHKIVFSGKDDAYHLPDEKIMPVGATKGRRFHLSGTEEAAYTGSPELIGDAHSVLQDNRPPKRRAAQHRSFSQYSFANIELEYDHSSVTESFDGVEDARKRADIKPRAYTVVHCDLCNEVLVTAMKAKEHFVKFHSGIGPYKCDICDQRFQSLYIRKNHMLKHQDDSGGARKRFPCDRCGKTFLKGYSLREHLLRHSQNDEKFAETGQRVSLSPKRQELVCDLCGTMLVTALKAKEHFIEHHDGMAPYKCFICDKRLWSMHTRKEHMALHEDFSMLRNTYTCEKCNKTFAKKASLQEHLLRHTKAETAEFVKNDLGQYPCKLCTDVFPTLEEVTAHFNDNHDKLGCHEDKTFRRLQVMTCDLCGEKLVTGIKAKSHFVEKHNGLPPYCCSKCDKRFHSAYARNKHLLSHEENFHEMRPKFPCSKCDKIFCSKFTLKKHKAQHFGSNEGDSQSTDHLSESQSHDEDGEVVYEVRVEEEDSIEYVEPFDSDMEPKPKNRRKGIYSTQQGDLDFSCVYCGSSFRYSHHLVTHMIKQHPEEEIDMDEEDTRHYCELCGDLLSEVRLSEHFITRHSGVSSNFCFICDKPFEEKEERELHLMMHKPRDSR